MAAIVAEDIWVDGPFGRLHVHALGQGDPLLLLHSVGCSAHEYAESAAMLAGDGYRVIAWDMPGHGDSGPLDRHYSIEQFAAAAIWLVDALGLESVHIAGASIGGVIALDAVRQAPSRFASLALVETGLQDDGAWAAMWSLVEATFAIPTQPEQAVAPRLRMLTDATLTRWNVDRNKAGGKAMMSAMWALRQYRYEEVLPQLTLPTLLLYGDRSPVGASVGVAAKAAPSSRTVIQADSGHFPMMDDPAAFARALSDFCRSSGE